MGPASEYIIYLSPRIFAHNFTPTLSQSKAQISLFFFIQLRTIFSLINFELEYHVLYYRFSKPASEASCGTLDVCFQIIQLKRY